jgi:hypothetical protein
MRFAGLVEIGLAELVEAADFVRTHDGSVLIVSRHAELTEERVRAIASRFFPRGEFATDWASVVEQVEEGEDVCIRASGGFDDREVWIDAFLSANLLPTLGRPQHGSRA